MYYNDHLKKEHHKLRKNDEGYSDPTACKGIMLADADEERFHKVLSAILCITSAADFELGERVVLVDKRTGKEWR